MPPSACALPSDNGEVKRLSIFTRLMVGYVFLLVLATSMSVYTIYQLGRVYEVTHSIILEDNTLMDVHKYLTDAALAETRYEKKFVIMNDQALYDGFLSARKEFEVQLGRALMLARSSALQEALRRASELHARYQELFGQELGHLRNGESYGAAQFRADKDALANSLLEQLQTVRSLVQQDIFLKITKLNDAGASAINVAMVITGSSLAVGILIAILITRSITVPLARIRKKTAEIGNGKYEADLRLASPPEIGALAKAINLMSARIKEVDRLKSDFYARMSHELRTPLTSIKEGTNLLREGKGGPVTDRQTRILTIIREESDRLIDLVSSLLDLSKLEAGMLTYNFTKAELASLVSQVVVEVAPLAEAKRVRIRTDVPAASAVKADPERILQVIRNLIGNALKFTPPDGSIHITIRRLEGGMGVSVADTGPGIPKEQQEIIFDKFQQAAVKGVTVMPGSGLGLAIVKNIVQGHGGKVWVESEEGRGSTFTFLLPA